MNKHANDTDNACIHGVDRHGPCEHCLRIMDDFCGQAVKTDGE